MKLVSFLTEVQLIILKRFFSLTFIVLFSYLIFSFLTILALALGLIKEEGSFFDLHMYLAYLCLFVLLMGLLAMSVYGACYICYLWKEVGKGVAVYGAVLLLLGFAVIGYWWFYVREIRGKEFFPERRAGLNS